MPAIVRADTVSPCRLTSNSRVAPMSPATAYTQQVGYFSAGRTEGTVRQVASLRWPSGPVPARLSQLTSADIGHRGHNRAPVRIIIYRTDP